MTNEATEKKIEVPIEEKLKRKRPKYVNYGGLATLPGPYVSNETTLFGFVLEADWLKLYEVCNKVFAEPSKILGPFSHVGCIPITKYVLVTFGYIAELRTGTPTGDPSKIGYGTEAQAVLWIITCAWKDGGRTIEPLCLFTPYIFVENPFSFACGREVQGFAKNWGWIDGIPEDAINLNVPDPPEKLTLDTYGIKTYDATSETKRYNLFNLTRGNAIDDGQNIREWTKLEDFGRAIASSIFETSQNGGPCQFIHQLEKELQKLGPMGKEIDKLLMWLLEKGEKEVFEIVFKGLRSNTLTQFFLNQFRSISNGHDACYQAITEAPMKIKEIQGGRMKHNYSFSLNHLDSHPITEQLGIESGQAASFPFWIKMDFVVENGTVIWEAS